MKFLVMMREVHVQVVEIEAEDEQEAIGRVEDGEGDYRDGTEYDCTLDSDEWTVEECK